MPTPSWSAARAGVLGDTGAVNGSAQVNQFLGAHQGNIIYRGNQILTPNGTGGDFGSALSVNDKAQPFTLVGTSIGRVEVPVVPFGTGADLVVSLCTNNAGVPGTVVSQTRIPAAWFLWLGSYIGITDTDPVQFNPSGSPLATPQTNTFTMGNVVNFNFTGGTPSGGFGTTGPIVTSNGTDTIVVAGGLNAAGTAVTNVFTISYEGINALQNMLPQPTLPIGLDAYSGIAVSTDPSNGSQYVIIAGGQTGSTGSYSTIANVYVSQLSGANGQMSAWTTQTSLPQAVQTLAGAASGNYVYMTGGVSSGGSVLNTVYWANIQNGQITSWNTGPALPVGVYDHFCAAINGYLFVIGGYTQPGNTSPTANVWYSQINSDGSLDAWQTGPPLPTVNATTDTTFTAGSDGIMIRGGVSFQGLWSLTVGVNGPRPIWQSESFPGSNFGALLNNGPGQYYWFEGFTNASTNYNSAGFSICPYLSVPLPASGLTNGATYWIVLQQPSGPVDLNNYLQNIYDFNVFPGNPTQLFRARGTTTWNTDTVAIPMTIYDNSDNVGGINGNNLPYHTYDDGGKRMSTIIYTGTPDHRVLGVVDATQQPGPVLNANWSFSNGTAPWSNVNGIVTQSNAFTHGNLPFSAKFVPTGGIGQAYIESELIPIELYQPYAANAWFYSPTGWTDCEILINWYTAAGFGGGFISSTVGTVASVAANTWTPFAVGGTQPPSTAVYATMGIYERSTPPATAVFYVSAATIQAALSPQLASAVTVDYAGGFGSTGMWPPVSATQLT